MIEFKCDKCETVHRLVDPPEIQQLRAKLALATEALRFYAQVYDDGYSKTARDALTALGAPASPTPDTPISGTATQWEADHQAATLRRHGLADEFPFGCDSIDAVAEALLYARAKLKALTEKDCHQSVTKASQAESAKAYEP